VEIQPERAAIAGLAAASGFYNSDDEEYQMETELAGLRSHQLARKVAKVLALENNPEFNGTEPQAAGLGDAMLSVRRRVMDPVLSLFRGNEAPASTAKAIPQPDTADGPQETPEEAKRVEQLMSRRAVDRVVGTRLVKITIESRHREFAAEAANAFAQVYVEQNLLSKTAALTHKAEQARKTADAKKLELQIAKQNYLNAQRESPTGASIDSTIMGSWVAQAQQEWNKAKIETQNKKSAYETLAKIDISDPEVASQAAPAFSGNRFVVDNQQEILKKRRDLEQLRKVEKLGPENPRVTAAQTDLEIAKGQLKANLQQIVDLARQEYESSKTG
jgi:uncharacterized protein involved in exopolysaccharide biosynthesis